MLLVTVYLGTPRWYTDDLHSTPSGTMVKGHLFFFLPFSSSQVECAIAITCPQLRISFSFRRKGRVRERVSYFATRLSLCRSDILCDPRSEWQMRKRPFASKLINGFEACTCTCLCTCCRVRETHKHSTKRVCHQGAQQQHEGSQ